MTDVPTATPQPAAPPVEAAAPVGEPTAAPQPQTDPRLAHLLQHYLPEGIDLDTELMHVVQGVGEEGEPTFHYRPLVPVSAVTPTEEAPVPSAVPAPAEATAPVVPQPAAVPAAPTQFTHQASSVVAAAPAGKPDPDAMNDEDFDSYYNALLDADLANRQTVLASGL